MTNALVKQSRAFEHNGREYYVFDDVMRSLGRSPRSLKIWNDIVPKQSRLRARVFDTQQGCVPTKSVRCLDQTGVNSVLAYHQSKAGTHGRGVQLIIPKDNIFFKKVMG
jgi:hypothetical protein